MEQTSNILFQVNNNSIVLSSMLLDNLPSPILVVNCMGVVTYLNKAAEVTFCGDRGSILDKCLVDALYGGVKFDYEGKYLSPINECLEQGLAFYQKEFTIKLIFDQSPRKFLVTCAPIVNSVGEVLGACGVYHEIATYDDLEKQLNELNLYANDIGTICGFIEMIGLRNPMLKKHSINVATISQTTARELGLGDKAMKEAFLAGLLHDLGKVAIPGNILNKKGKLTTSEYTIVKKHPGLSAEIVSHIASLKEISPIILAHHERYDGNGYPQGLKGAQIPILSRIIAVADAFDSMTSERSYRQRFSKEKAFEELRRYSRSQFDPKIVEAFLGSFKENKLLFTNKKIPDIKESTEQNNLDSTQTSPGTAENIQEEGERGRVWIKDGKVFVVTGNKLPPYITPCEGVKLRVNGYLCRAKTSVNEKDEIVVEPEELVEPRVLEVKVLPDYMSAFLTIELEKVVKYKVLDQEEPQENLVIKVAKEVGECSLITFEDILKEIFRKQISYGIKYDAIQQFLSEPKNCSFLVAEGELQESSEDENMELFFPTDLERRPTFQADGKADFRELNFVFSVEEGSVLAKKSLAVFGKPGKNIKGEMVLAKDPRVITLKTGSGATISEDGTTVIASVSGCPKVVQNGSTRWFKVVPVITVNNVDLRTGNIRFLEDIKVLGNVSDGMTVSAGGNLEVNGICTNAKVYAIGSMVFKGYVLGSVIQVGGAMVNYKKLIWSLGEFMHVVNLLLETLLQIPKHLTNKITPDKALDLVINKKFRHFPNAVNGILDLACKCEVELIPEIQECINVLSDLGNNVFDMSKLQTVRELLNTAMKAANQQDLNNSSVFLRYVQSSIIGASGDVVVSGQGCYNTNIFAGGKVKVTGVLRGGSIQASEVFINEAGSEMGVKTVIKVPENKSIIINKVNSDVTLYIGKYSKNITETITGVRARLGKDGCINVH